MVLPEGYGIASLLVIMTQAGNVVGLLHFALRSLESAILRKHSVLAVLVFGAVVAVLIGLFWDTILLIDGQPKRY